MLNTYSAIVRTTIESLLHQFTPQIAVFVTLYASTHGVHAFMACLQATIMHSHLIEAVVYGDGS